MSKEVLRVQDKLRYTAAVLAGGAIGIAGWQLATDIEDSLVDERAMIESVEICARSLPSNYPEPVDKSNKPGRSTLPEQCLFDEERLRIPPSLASTYENVENREEAVQYLALTAQQYRAEENARIEYRSDWASNVGKFVRTATATIGLIVGLGLIQDAHDKRQVS